MTLISQLFNEMIMYIFKVYIEKKTEKYIRARVCATNYVRNMRQYIVHYL